VAVRRHNPMKRKTLIKPKSTKTPAKTLKKKAVMKDTGRVVRMPSQPPAKLPLGKDPRFSQVVESYESGLKALADRKYEKAKTLFEKVVAGPNRELADRARINLNICNQQLSRTTTTFKSPDEHYDYVVSLTNTGEYEAAREHLDKMAKQYPKADYVWYGLAVLDSLQGRGMDAMQHLEQAIKLNSANRIQARNDTDFQSLFDDPRFTELLYPEAGSDSVSARGEEEEE
jgi:tetratricopeptide (TPR) repeat protein